MILLTIILNTRLQILFWSVVFVRWMQTVLALISVFTDKPSALSNDVFVNLLYMSTKWSKSEKREGICAPCQKSMARKMVKTDSPKTL